MNPPYRFQTASILALCWTIVAATAADPSPVRKIYYAVGADLYRANPDGTGAIWILTDPTGNIHQIVPDLGNETLYWSSGTEISRFRLDGSAVEHIVSMGLQPGSFGLDRSNGDLFYSVVDISPNSWRPLFKRAPSGETVEITDLGEFHRWFIVDDLNDRIYVEQEDTFFHWISFDGADSGRVFSPELFRPVWNISPRARFLYYASDYFDVTDGRYQLVSDDGNMRRVGVDGGSTNDVWNVPGVTVGSPRPVAVDAATEEIYYPSSGGLRKGHFGDTTTEIVPIPSSIIALDSSVTTDTTPPLLQITSPADSANTSADVVTVSGAVSDDQIFVRLQWEHNSVEQGRALANDDGSFAIPDIVLVEGHNTIRVIAEDAAGNRSTDEITITLAPEGRFDLGPPVSVSEGDFISIPIRLDSRGNISGMTFSVDYPQTYIADGSLEFTDFIDQRANHLTFANVGTFSAGSQALPAGQHTVAIFTARAMSVPEDVELAIALVVHDISDPAGNALDVGPTVDGTTVSIAQREIVGDINTNGLLDIGDAHLMQQLLASWPTIETWDHDLNDLNGNGFLDSGDLTRALRTVVGLDPQPNLPLTLASTSIPPGPRVVLDTSNQYPTVGEDLVVQVLVQDLPGGFQGVSVTIDYDVSAFRLEGPASHQVGELLEGGSLEYWNLAPSEDDYSAQTGTITLAATGVSGREETSGVLAELTFNVQGALTDQGTWPIVVREATISSDGGYEAESAQVSTLLIAGQSQSYEEWLADHFDAEEMAAGVLTGWEVDSDFDGQCNGQEYVGGTDPRTAGEAQVSSRILQGGVPAIQFKRAVNAIEGGFTLMKTKGLREWYSVSPAQVQRLSDPETGTETIALGFEEKLEQVNRLFLKVDFIRLSP